MTAARTFSPLLPDDVLTLAVQELQVIGHHPLLALVEDFGVGAGVEVLPTPHLLVFQPSQDLQERNEGWGTGRGESRGVVWGVKGGQGSRVKGQRFFLFAICAKTMQSKHIGILMQGFPNQVQSKTRKKRKEKRTGVSELHGNGVILGQIQGLC